MSDGKQLDNEIFDQWASHGYFQRTKGFGKYANVPYTVVIPPPNVTGVLHMGHALNDSIQDACVRRARMQGKQTRWILGTDHAGIATQTKVDKMLAEKGINKRDIGRDAFIEECQKWRDQYGSTIVSQIKAMGCSCDYANEQFTMSPEFSLAVRKLFVDWYHNDVIYRGKRIVNWCPSCTTAIADDEAEYENQKGHLWYLRYPLEEPVDGIEYLTVATTRPETMLGDSGVAVSPKDERYKNLVGKNVILPIVDRKIPVFSDFYVDMEYGTGAVKVTPAHDPNDYAMGQRHDLEQINIFDETAHVIDGFGEFSGMSRDQARQRVVERFEELGLLEKIEDIEHSVMHCYRCHNALEPWLSEQWFVSVDSLKQAARKAVEDKEIVFYPDRWSHVYLDWLENLKDWCISRQLWWGHRIPMYYCDECGWQDASVEEIDICPVCGAHTRQDEDVLDTWFSSQLWPFATQGWGEYGMDSEDLKDYYPTQLLSTARDIMGLWVARMVMASEYCTGQIPFQEVIIHPTVLGADGKPMSKSRGNGVDPIELMESFGADGMRFGLLSQVTGSQTLRFNEERILAGRNFANKVRNAARFITMHLDGFEFGEPCASSPSDGWILSRLAHAVKGVEKAYSKYDFSEMTSVLYNFCWNEFCDWYIEFSKSRLSDDADRADKLICQQNLYYVLLNVIKLLHPVMPFLTEEIYKSLPKQPSDPKMLMIAPWPEASELEKWSNPEAERATNLICDVVGAVRSARSRYNISPKTDVEVVVKASHEDISMIEEERSEICSLAKISNMSASVDAAKPKGSCVGFGDGIEVYTILSGLIDVDAERARLEKELGSLRRDEQKFAKKLSNEGFLSKASPEVIEKDRAKHDSIVARIAQIEEQIEDLS